MAANGLVCVRSISGEWRWKVEGGMVCVDDGGGDSDRTFDICYVQMSFVCRDVMQEPSSSSEPIYGGVLWARIGKQPPTPCSIFHTYIIMRYTLVFTGIYICM